MPEGNLCGSGKYGGALNNTWGGRLEFLRHHLWLVLVVVVMALLGAGASSTSSRSEYTGASSLVVEMGYQNAEREAMLATGYVDFFNSDSYQQSVNREVKRLLGTSDDIELAARTAADSPIILITATSGSPDLALSAAAKAAEQLRSAVNVSVPKQPDGSQPPEPPGGLEILQAQVGVTEAAQNRTMNAVLGGLGGLVLGCGLVFLLASLSKRIWAASDVRDKAGITLLSEFPRGRGESAERRRAVESAQLARLVVSRAPGGADGDQARPVLAVLTPTSSPAAGRVAELVAENSAAAGDRSLLVQANLAAHPDTGASAGIAQALGSPERTTRELIVDGPVDGMTVLPPGHTDGRQVRFTRAGARQLLQRASRDVDIAVVESPPILESPDASAICAAADATVLVIERGATIVADAQKAKELVEQAGGKLLGAIVVDRDRLADARDYGTSSKVESRAAPPRIRHEGRGRSLADTAGAPDLVGSLEPSAQSGAATED
jgi:polysaccharide biosynthesis transport protein